jgi:hypothetical protein
MSATAACSATPGHNRTPPTRSTAPKIGEEECDQKIIGQHPSQRRRAFAGGAEAARPARERQPEKRDAKATGERQELTGVVRPQQQRDHKRWRHDQGKTGCGFHNRGKRENSPSRVEACSAHKGRRDIVSALRSALIGHDSIGWIRFPLPSPAGLTRGSVDRRVKPGDDGLRSAGGVSEAHGIIPHSNSLFMTTGAILSMKSLRAC